MLIFKLMISRELLHFKRFLKFCPLLPLLCKPHFLFLYLPAGRKSSKTKGVLCVPFRQVDREAEKLGSRIMGSRQREGPGYETGPSWAAGWKTLLDSSLPISSLEIKADVDDKASNMTFA